MYEKYLTGLIFLSSLHFCNVMVPGPTMALIIRNSIYSRRDGIKTVSGASFGSFMVKFLSILGIAILISHTPWLFRFIQLAGGGYLIFLGFLAFKKALKDWDRYRSPDADSKGREKEASSDLAGLASPFLSGFLMNTSNPMNGLGFLVIFSTAIDPQMPFILQFSYIVVMWVISFVCLSFVALFCSTEKIQDTLYKYRFIVNTTIGIVMLSWGAMVWRLKMG